jgi:hypothetical protein
MMETSKKEMAPSKTTGGSLLFNQLILRMEHISTSLVGASNLMMKTGIKNHQPTNSAAEEMQSSKFSSKVETRGLRYIFFV